METENVTESSRAETVIRYLDYRTQAEQRRKELDSLREQCLANTRASRLSNAEAPEEMATFLQRQRDLFEQERLRRKEAQDFIHGFREEDGIPPKISHEKDGELQKEDALAFMHGYKVAKESILRRTEAFWKERRKNDTKATSQMPLVDAVGACSKRWEANDRELDELVTEMELISAASMELIAAASEESEVELMFFKDGKTTTWTLLWLSIMTMCSSNIVGLVLSLALLNYNLRPETARYEDIIHVLGDGKFFSICREILNALRQSSSDEIPDIERSESERQSWDELARKVNPDYKGVRDVVHENLKKHLDQWMADSATLLRNAVVSVRDGTDGDRRLSVPSLLSMAQKPRSTLALTGQDASSQKGIFCNASTIDDDFVPDIPIIPTFNDFSSPSTSDESEDEEFAVCEKLIAPSNKQKMNEGLHDVTCVDERDEVSHEAIQDDAEVRQQFVPSFAMPASTFSISIDAMSEDIEIMASIPDNNSIADSSSSEGDLNSVSDGSEDILGDDASDECEEAHISMESSDIQISFESKNLIFNDASSKEEDTSNGGVVGVEALYHTFSTAEECPIKQDDASVEAVGGNPTVCGDQVIATTLEAEERIESNKIVECASLSATDRNVDAMWNKNDCSQANVPEMVIAEDTSRSDGNEDDDVLRDKTDTKYLANRSGDILSTTLTANASDVMADTPATQVEDTSDERNLYNDKIVQLTAGLSAYRDFDESPKSNDFIYAVFPFHHGPEDRPPGTHDENITNTMAFGATENDFYGCSTQNDLSHVDRDDIADIVVPDNTELSCQKSLNSIDHLVVHEDELVQNLGEDETVNDPEKSATFEEMSCHHASVGSPSENDAFAIVKISSGDSTSESLPTLCSETELHESRTGISEGRPETERSNFTEIVSMIDPDQEFGAPILECHPSASKVKCVDIVPEIDDEGESEAYLQSNDTSQDPCVEILGSVPEIDLEGALDTSGVVKAPPQIEKDADVVVVLEIERNELNSKNKGLWNTVTDATAANSPEAVSELGLDLLSCSENHLVAEHDNMFTIVAEREFDAMSCGNEMPEGSAAFPPEKYMVRDIHADLATQDPPSQDSQEVSVPCIDTKRESVFLSTTELSQPHLDEIAQFPPGGDTDKELDLSSFVEGCPEVHNEIDAQKGSHLSVVTKDSLLAGQDMIADMTPDIDGEIKLGESSKNAVENPHDREIVVLSPGINVASECEAQDDIVDIVREIQAGSFNAPDDAISVVAAVLEPCVRFDSILTLETSLSPAMIMEEMLTDHSGIEMTSLLTQVTTDNIEICRPSHERETDSVATTSLEETADIAHNGMVQDNTTATIALEFVNRISAPIHCDSDVCSQGDGFPQIVEDGEPTDSMLIKSLASEQDLGDKDCWESSGSASVPADGDTILFDHFPNPNSDLGITDKISAKDSDSESTSSLKIATVKAYDENAQSDARETSVSIDDINTLTEDADGLEDEDSHFSEEDEKRNMDCCVETFTIDKCLDDKYGETSVSEITNDCVTTSPCENDGKSENQSIDSLRTVNEDGIDLSSEYHRCPEDDDVDFNFKIEEVDVDVSIALDQNTCGECGQGSAGEYDGKGPETACTTSLASEEVFAADESPFDGHDVAVVEGTADADDHHNLTAAYRENLSDDEITELIHMEIEDKRDHDDSSVGSIPAKISVVDDDDATKTTDGLETHKNKVDEPTETNTGFIVEGTADADDHHNLTAAYKENLSDDEITELIHMEIEDKRDHDDSSVGSILAKISVVDDDDATKTTDGLETHKNKVDEPTETNTGFSLGEGCQDDDELLHQNLVTVDPSTLPACTGDAHDDEFVLALEKSKENFVSDDYVPDNKLDDVGVNCLEMSSVDEADSIITDGIGTHEKTASVENGETCNLSEGLPVFNNRFPGHAMKTFMLGELDCGRMPNVDTSCNEKLISGVEDQGILYNVETASVVTDIADEHDDEIDADRLGESLDISYFSTPDDTVIEDEARHDTLAAPFHLNDSSVSCLSKDTTPCDDPEDIALHAHGCFAASQTEYIQQDGLIQNQDSFVDTTGTSLKDSMNNSGETMTFLDVSETHFDDLGLDQINNVELTAASQEVSKFSWPFFQLTRNTSSKVIPSIDASLSVESDELCIPERFDMKFPTRIGSDECSESEDDNEVDSSMTNQNKSMQPFRLVQNASTESDNSSRYESKIPRPPGRAVGKIRSSLKKLAGTKYVSKIPGRTTGCTFSNNPAVLDIFHENAEGAVPCDYPLDNDGKENLGDESGGNDYLNMCLESADTMSTIHLSDSHGEDGFHIISSMFNCDEDILGLFPKQNDNFEIEETFLNETNDKHDEGMERVIACPEIGISASISKFNTELEWGNDCPDKEEADEDSTDAKSVHTSCSEISEEFIEGNGTKQQPTEVPAKENRSWDTSFIALGAVVVVGLGATAAIGMTRNKRH